MMADRWQGEQALPDCREPCGVVVPLTREYRDLIASLVQLSTPAVDLDFMKPLRPLGGWLFRTGVDGMMKGLRVRTPADGEGQERALASQAGFRARSIF